MLSDLSHCLTLISDAKQVADMAGDLTSFVRIAAFDEALLRRRVTLSVETVIKSFE